MKKISKKFLILEIVFIMLMSVSGIYALTTDEITKKLFSTGIVKIQLKEFTLNSENEEVQYDKDKENVVNGERISLIPKTYILGDDCYIRFKVSMATSNVIIDNSNYIEGISNKWKKVGNYYYYDSVAETGKNINLFNTLIIPNDEGQQLNEEIRLNIVVEAIQSKNFEQDLTLKDPWNGIEIEQSIENSYSIGKDEKRMIIKYENNTNENITISENLFEKLKNVMPGDNINENLIIKNNRKNVTEYFFSIENNELSEIEKDILNKISFTIMDNNEKVIYKGNLLDNTKVLLGKYKVNEQNSLIFKISVPKELQKKYSLLNIKTIWKFSAYEEVEDENNEKPENKKDIKKTGNPKTGDSEIDLSIKLFFISAIGLIIVLILDRRERNKIK